jgi:DNA-binding cell septation regulator SpoVG
MIAAPAIRVGRVTPAPADAHSHGLLAFVELDIGGLLRIDATIRRRERGGSLYVSFPAPKGRDGRPRELVRPLDQSAREHLEREILTASHHQIPDLVPPAPSVAAPRSIPGDSP